MKINLGRLKLRKHESEVFYFKEPGGDSSLGIPGAQFLKPVEVELTVENTGRLMVGRGTVKTVVQLPCSRCLKDFSYPIDEDLHINMAEDIHSDRISSDEDIILFGNDEADILPRVYEALFMAVPLNPLCSQDCQGLCNICGTDLNTGSCSCQDNNLDPRWEKLKNLR